MSIAAKPVITPRKRRKRAARLRVLPRIWEKGQKLPDRNPEIWRLDAFGALIKKTDYGNHYSKHGWEIDHILSNQQGGSDDLSNLQPVQWERKGSQSGVSRR